MNLFKGAIRRLFNESIELTFIGNRAEVEAAHMCNNRVSVKPFNKPWDRTNPFKVFNNKRPQHSPTRIASPSHAVIFIEELVKRQALEDQIVFAVKGRSRDHGLQVVEERQLEVFQGFFLRCKC